MAPMGGGPIGPVGPPEDQGYEAQGQGQGIGGGFPSPAPPQVNPVLDLVVRETRNIVSSTRRIVEKLSSAGPEVREIHRQLGIIAQKVQSSGPQQEPMAPPV